MYIIELFYKLKKKKQKTYQQEEENQTCQHVFVPIDSEGKTLACIECGLVITPKSF